MLVVQLQRTFKRLQRLSIWTGITAGSAIVQQITKAHYVVFEAKTFPESIDINEFKRAENLCCYCFSRAYDVWHNRDVLIHSCFTDTTTVATVWSQSFLSSNIGAPPTDKNSGIATCSSTSFHPFWQNIYILGLWTLPFYFRMRYTDVILVPVPNTNESDFIVEVSVLIWKSLEYTRSITLSINNENMTIAAPRYCSNNLLPLKVIHKLFEVLFTDDYSYFRVLHQPKRS